jgi:hypothetical protein
LVAPVDGVAFDLPATGRSVRQFLAFGLALLVGALVMLGVCVWVWVGDRASHDLQRNGVRTQTPVLERSVRYLGRERQPFGSITVRGATDASRVAIPVGASVLRFHVGDQVTVVHRRGGSEYQVLGIVPDAHGIPLMVPLTFCLLLAAFASLASRHGRLARRVTRSNRWVAVPARVVAVPYSAGLGQRSGFVLALRGLDDRSIVVQPVGLRRLTPSFEPVAWTAGVADRRFVVSTPGGGRVLCVEEVRATRWWQRRREPDPDRPPIA